MTRFNKSLRLTNKDEHVLEAMNKLAYQHREIHNAPKYHSWFWREIKSTSEFRIDCLDSVVTKVTQVYRCRGKLQINADQLMFDAVILLTGTKQTVWDWQYGEYEVGEPLTPERVWSRLYHESEPDKALSHFRRSLK